MSRYTDAPSTSDASSGSQDHKVAIFPPSKGTALALSSPPWRDFVSMSAAASVATLGTASAVTLLPKASAKIENDGIRPFQVDVPEEALADLSRRVLETRWPAKETVAAIEGLDIQFIHLRSGHAGSPPLIIAHGRPGSVLELLKFIAPLADRMARNGSAEDAFDGLIERRTLLLSPLSDAAERADQTTVVVVAYSKPHIMDGYDE